MAYTGYWCVAYLLPAIKTCAWFLFKHRDFVIATKCCIGIMKQQMILTDKQTTTLSLRCLCRCYTLYYCEIEALPMCAGISYFQNFSFL